MNRAKYFLPALLLIFVTLLACNNQAQEKDDVNISVNELKTAMQTDSNLVILDVRTPQELVGPLGKIEGVVNIPVQVLEKNIHELDNYKDKNIAVICRSGNRSNYGTKILLKYGFKAKNVLGGMRAYNKLK